MAFRDLLFKCLSAADAFLYLNISGLNNDLNERFPHITFLCAVL